MTIKKEQSNLRKEIKAQNKKQKTAVKVQGADRKWESNFKK
jgi:hypothetical protein